MNVVAKWPGQCHDSFILRHSDLWRSFESGKMGLILGDSGYPCRRWLLTPYLNPGTPAQRHFNAAQKKTRCIIEQAFGSLKRRWAILGSTSGCCRLTTDTVAKVVTACCVLQNIAIDRQQPEVGIGEEAGINDDNDIEFPDDLAYTGPLATGNAYRDHIANAHFA